MKTITIQHVKWRKAHDAGLVNPAADTDSFGQLTNRPRETLTFTPAEEDYGPKRDEVAGQVSADE